MKRHPRCAALAALLILAAAPSLDRNGAALAAGPEFATGFTIASDDGGLIASDVAAGPISVDVLLAASRYQPVRATEFSVAPPRYESSRYRPRRERYRERESSRARGISQFHAGFLDPDGAADPGFLLGFRGGTQIDELIQIGLGIDWRHKTGRSTEVLQQTTGPGGQVIEVQRDLTRYSSNLVPGLAYLQLSGPSHLGVIPYFGVAASWQLLFLSADDFQTGQSFEGTYDGFGWQMWGGAAVPLSRRSKLVGEVFLNDAELNRDVFDEASGADVHETVSANGIGARFGLSWGF